MRPMPSLEVPFSLGQTSCMDFNVVACVTLRSTHVVNRDAPQGWADQNAPKDLPTEAP